MDSAGWTKVTDMMPLDGREITVRAGENIYECAVFVDGKYYNLQEPGTIQGVTEWDYTGDHPC